AQLLNQKPPCTRSWQNFCHYVAVSEVMIRVRQAIARQSRVVLNDLFLEHSIVNAEADEPERRYKLYSVVSAPTDPRRIICAPDAAFELRAGSSPHRR